jgi:putative membrane protein
MGTNIMALVSLDLMLAIAHHLLIFSLAGVLAFEIGALHRHVSADDIRRIARVDIWYGILAGALIAVGFSRAIFAAKGWTYYAGNPFFHAKMGAFICVGLLSAPPTIAFIRWRKALTKDPNFLPTLSDIQSVRRFLWLEVGFFALIPVFAAAMARVQV